ncbi:MAG TPA: NADH-quinone oxidoreductase subunit NuoG [Roseiflexaceae bacterium]|nr:NADH-quinone oxidoreductase subunit NuoG [Roseiflexaceae bacterium]
MAKLTIDGKEYEVSAGANVLHAALSLGLDLPYFCWHPALGSVGACRLCAVKQFRDASDTRGRLVMACLTPADGARLSIADEEARTFRRSVIEWLMANHPHDCPVCDEGGECHLQDMTLMTGHTRREYRFPKRTYRNQYLGPFINHEMNRCIQCYRCVRFYGDYAGGHDLQAFASRDRVYFGRHAPGVLESEFSGNLVEVCPTGVFTDKTLKQHYTRKWDLQTAPSVCVHCAVGCNTIPGERYGTLRRVRSRYNHEVNGYFLCDRGRFGYEFVNSERRIRQPLLRRDGALVPVSADEALERAAAILRESAGVVGIGSPRAALEANFALRRLAGPERFIGGMSPGEDRLVALALRILRAGPARSPSLADMGRADAVLVLGEDVTNTAPMVALALRQAVRRQPMQIAQRLGIPEWNDAAVREAMQDQRGPLFIATPAATRLDDVAAHTYRAAPDDIARLGFAVARALDDAAPPAPDLPDALRALADQIAHALAAAERPLVLAGISLGSEALLQAAANVAWALCQGGRPAELCLVAPECNTLGVGLLGGGTLGAAVEALRFGAADTLVVLENDLFRRADPAMAEALLGAAKHIIAIDHLESATTVRAEVVLPAATFAEGDGTLVNMEGRAQRFFQVFAPEGAVQESWRWVRDMLCATGRGADAPWMTLEDIDAELASEVPQLAGVTEAVPPAGLRVPGAKIPRQLHRYSGRTAMRANISVHEPKPPEDRDSPLAFSMEGPFAPPPALASEFWSPGWNSAQAINKFQSEVGGPLHGGAPGRRLIEPAAGTPSYFRDVPPPFAPREHELLLVPLHHIFGSEELSVLTPGVAELAPQPYVALHPADADELGVAGGDLLAFAAADGGAALRLERGEGALAVRILPSLPRGVAGVPVGLPGTAGPLPAGWCRVIQARARGHA